MSNIEVFNYDGFNVRTVIGEDGNPWFVGKDVAMVLGYSETSAMTRRLDDDETMSVKLAGMNMNSTLLSESGVYEAIFGSKVETAKKFKRWLKTEVLPAIRKTGGYLTEKSDDTPEEIMARALLVAQDTLKRREERIKQLEFKVEEDKPLVDFASKVSLSTDAIDVGLFAKIVKDENIHLGRNKLFKWFKENKYLMGNNEPYQEYIDRDYFKVIEQTFNTPYGNKISFKTLVTPKGQMFFIKKLQDEFC